MVYVVAGNNVEAVHWMRSCGLVPNKDATYVRNHEQLIGQDRGLLYVRVGMWYRHPDIDAIDEAIISREAMRYT